MWERMDCMKERSRKETDKIVAVGSKKAINNLDKERKREELEDAEKDVTEYG